MPDQKAEIVLYCGGGYRSALAAENLQKMGYTNVYSMDGGIRGWREKNYPQVWLLEWRGLKWAARCCSSRLRCCRAEVA